MGICGGGRSRSNRYENCLNLFIGFNGQHADGRRWFLLAAVISLARGVCRFYIHTYLLLLLLCRLVIIAQYIAILKLNIPSVVEFCLFSHNYFARLRSIKFMICFVSNCCKYLHKFYNIWIISVKYLLSWSVQISLLLLFHILMWCCNRLSDFEQANHTL